jgi:hypothetical protein
MWIVVLLPPALWVAVWSRNRIHVRSHADRSLRDDPERLREIQDGVRRRRDGSGPTVGGGQHIG